MISAALALVLLSAAARAATLQFDRITSNATTDVAADLTIEILDFGSTAAILATNDDSSGSFITQIYLEDNAGGIAAVSALDFIPGSSVGDVFFESGNGPASLPSGNNANFITSLSLGADNPLPKRGISSGELGWFEATLAVDFDYLTAGLQDGSVRFGMHVQGIPEGSGTTSDSFVSQPLPEIEVPEPSSGIFVVLAGAAMLLRRRRSMALP